MTTAALTPIDELYLARACELATRGIGNVSPNPPVGAVIVHPRLGTLGEGFHHRRGEAHAEVEALRDAAARGFGPAELAEAVFYVSLEPCNHHGRTPPCSAAVTAAAPRRVVVGTLDPNPRTAGGGVRTLRDAGIAVVVAEAAAARELIRHFARAVTAGRPYVTLKLAASLDGRIAPCPGRYALTAEPARRFVRELRAAHDIVLVGAGTARIDDPLLTVRPPRFRLRPQLRAVVCGSVPPPRELQLFAADGAARTWLLVPETALDAYAGYAACADVIPVAAVGADGYPAPSAVLAALAAREIGSVLCEGGPKLAEAWLAAGVVDRLEWLIAPRILATPTALPVFPGVSGEFGLRWESLVPLGADLRCAFSLDERPAASGNFERTGPVCSAD